MACASDSKKVGRLGSKPHDGVWHVRYGGKGIMIYWHVGKYGTCMYSQLKTCSSSEVAADGFGVRDTLEDHGLACTPSPPARDARDSCGPCCFWRGRLNVRGGLKAQWNQKVAVKS